MKQVPGNKEQHPVGLEAEKEEESVNPPQVMQIIKLVRTIPHTPQEILAAFNNKSSKQTTYRPLRKPLPPVRKPSPLSATIQPPPAQKLKPPLKTSTVEERTGLGADLGRVCGNINQFLNDLRPQIRNFLSNPSLPTWLPEGTDEATKEFYKQIGIPSVQGQPNLLFHRLGITKNPRVGSLFKGDAHQ